MSELGTKLRDARVEKGYTLNTLQQMTKIQKKYLQAIELGNYDEMPGSFYVRAFVKQYADTVGLDGDKLLEEYENELSLNKNEEETLVAEKEELPSRAQRYEEKEKNGIEALLSYLPLVLLVTIVVAIMIFLVIAINNINNEQKSEEMASNDSSTSIVSVVEPESSASSEVSESAEEESVEEVELSENDIRVGDQVLTLTSEVGEPTTYELNAAFNNYEFEIEGNAYVWVGIFEDGVIVEDTTVVEGETLEYTASSGTQEVRVSFGYTEGATLKVNGTVIEPVGQYLTETIIFRLPEDTDFNTGSETIELDIPEEDSDAEEFQGPAVLDPSNNTDGAE
ncbi:helix-turn-helix domain-containing protein [Aerococcaceae bacterium WGS1372]